MSKEAQIPLFLWIATAVVAHLLWGGGVDRVADVIEEGVEIREFAKSVRRYVHGTTRPVEITLLDDTEPSKDSEPAKEKESEDDEQESQDESTQDDEKKPEPAAKPAPEEKKKPEPKTEDEKKKEEEKKVEIKPVEEAKPPEPPEELDKKRVAVRQHVKDPDQADNPNADFMADQANHVKEQTQARITSTDQNDPLPTPGAGAEHASKSEDPGDSNETKILQSEDRKGNRDHAPGDRPPAQELRIAVMPAPAQKPGAIGPEKFTEGAKRGAPNAEEPSKLPAQKGQTAQAASHEAEAVPDTLDSSQGSWGVPGEREASLEQKGRAARKKRSLPPPRSRGVGDLLGLGAAGLSPGGLNLNLTPEVAVAAIGKEQLTREIRADGERRKSKHAGKWRPVGIERWRSAIENYVPSVKPGNQTALNTARVPFASYLNQVHSRIHPIFADQFLASLDNLPASDPQNREGLHTNLEIVLDRDEGRVHRLGVTRASGVTAFDVNALDSVYRAQPFGPPPREIVSPDGFVYFHWEFHRGPEACGTWNARPFILKGQPKSVPPELEPGTPPASEEQERHGSLGPRFWETLAAADDYR
jgi:hypothetical protein